MSEWERSFDALYQTYARAGKLKGKSAEERKDAVERELIANFVEKKIFTDKETARRLVEQHRNWAEKITDKLNDRIQKTVGSKEEKFLVDARNMFREMLHSGVKETAENKKSSGEEEEKLSLFDGIKTIIGYSQEEIEKISSKRIRIMENEAELDEFIDESLDATDNQKVKMFIGKISSDYADLIYKKTGVHLNNYNVSISCYEIRKILLNSHGNEKKESLRGQRAVEKGDLKKIIDIVADPDVIRPSDKLSSGGKPAVVFEKKMVDNYVYVQFVSDKHHTLDGQTMWITHKKSPSSAIDSSRELPIFTSETNSDKASIISISKTGGKATVRSNFLLREKPKTDEKCMKPLLIRV